MALIFGLTNALIVAFGKILLKKSMEELPGSIGFFLETLFGIILWGVFAFVSGININNVIYLLPYVFISAILSEAYVFFIYSKGKISIVGTVFASYSVFTIFFSRLINNEVLSSLLLLSVLVISLGTIIISIPSRLKTKDFSDLKSVFWGLSGALAVGISDTISKSALDDTSPGDFLICLALMQIPISLVYLRLEKQNPKILKSILKNPVKYKYVIVSAFLIALSMIFFWLTLGSDLASIASPITSTNVLFAIILAKFYLKEEMTRKSLIGILLIILGIVGIAIFNY